MFQELFLKEIFWSHIIVIFYVMVCVCEHVLFEEKVGQWLGRTWNFHWVYYNVLQTNKCLKFKCFLDKPLLNFYSWENKIKFISLYTGSFFCCCWIHNALMLVLLQKYFLGYTFFSFFNQLFSNTCKQKHKNFMDTLFFSRSGQRVCPHQQNS